MRQKLLTLLAGTALLLAACEETTTSAASNQASGAAGAADEFPITNSRILSRPTDSSALVEVRSLSNAPVINARLEEAARTFCGGEAQIGLPISTNRIGLNTIRQYLVRCQ